MTTHDTTTGHSRVPAEGPEPKAEVKARPAPAEGDPANEPPEFVVHAFTKQEIAEQSPEGLPPDRGSRRISIGVLTIVAAIAIATLLIGSIWIGWAGIIAAVVLLIVYFLSAWPAWNAGVLRRHEEEEAARQVRADLVQDRKEQDRLSQSESPSQGKVAQAGR